ncbi:MAG TPA: FAD-dependent oxidoreductase [Vicinamibacteria bacterium]|nr:FAD-dependent oxidoreductase [Vicinamibacteria bacterium]
MERADVLIVGGGPAGSSCAAALAAAGRDVLVLDRHAFPRDKPCAGWITPEAVARLGLRLDEYGKTRTLQPISRFRIGRIGGRTVDVEYGEPVSYGIRRCEFDAELLRRSGARTSVGTAVTEVRREGCSWVLNGRFAAPVLVGAGGHFCPVARELAPSGRDEPVVAQEVEFRLEADMLEGCRVEPERPELYFSPDLLGYGWCFRKGAYLNVGLGRRDRRGLRQHVDAFLDWLVATERIAASPRAGWRGHAYLVREATARGVSADGSLLVGDAAGLAAAASGEGILPAIVSGQLAAEAILETGGALDGARLGRVYEQRLSDVLGRPPRPRRPPGAFTTAAGAVLLSAPWFARHVVLDRWFLHRRPGGRRGGPGAPARPSGMPPRLESPSVSPSV